MAQKPKKKAPSKTARGKKGKPPVPSVSKATCEPAYRVTRLFATPERSGDDVLAEICQITPNGVWRWRAPVANGGQGGVIPAVHHWRILAAARDRQLPLTADDLVWRPQPLRRPNRLPSPAAKKKAKAG